MTDVAISEIAFSDLLEIEDNLLRQSHCDDAVQRLLKANKQVCPGYAALSATTFYKVHVDAKLEAGADSKVPVIKAVKQALQEHADSKVHIQSADELSGENLFYGIQLSSLCITADTASEPSRLPQTPAKDGSPRSSL